MSSDRIKYAAKNWPWMKGMLLSNLDASTSPYHQGPQDGLPWFAILNTDYSPRPAWQAFKDMTTQLAATRAPRAAATTGADRRRGESGGGGSRRHCRRSDGARDWHRR